LIKSFISLAAVETGEDLELLYKEVFRRIKYLMQPITPPNKDVEQAVRLLFKLNGLSPPIKRRYRKARTKSSKKN